MSVTEKKFTPGEWKVRWGTNVFAGEEKDHRCVANCGTMQGGADFEKVYQENRANAYLTSAAPNLLAVAEKVVSIVWELSSLHGNRFDNRTAIGRKLDDLGRQAVRAISKALEIPKEEG